MAKKKRRAKQTTKSTGQTAVEEREPEVVSESIDGAIEQLVGRWNRLVSTTNWEKGQIICDWRDALIASGAAVTDYSDEAWAQLVGGVTGQHVGRLRRVFQRFGETYEQYDGLFWSHFQAALDWENAEMWLEGAIQSEWSISQMRGKRWETLGTPPEQQQAELAEEESTGEGLSSEEFFPEAESATTAEKTVGETSNANEPIDTEMSFDDGETASDEDSAGGDETVQPEPRKALKIDVDQLPEDLAEAFEAFKLAIIAHRHGNWQAVSQEQMLGCLDALRELTLVAE